MSENKLAFIGAGLIGSGLAVNAVTHGIPAAVQTRSQVERTTNSIENGIKFLLEKGVIDEAKAAEARSLYEQGKGNVQIENIGKTNGEIVRENIFTYFNLIFLILAILLIISGAFNSLTFLPVIVCNALIGIFQGIRAKKILDDLKVLNQTSVMQQSGSDFGAFRKSVELFQVNNSVLFTSKVSESALR